MDVVHATAKLPLCKGPAGPAPQSKRIGRGWLNKARSLQESNRPKEAHDTLIEANKRFPNDRIVLYDLACVCCMMQRLKEVDHWLAKAIEIGGKQLKTKALDDPSFDQFWKRIGEV